MAFCNNCKGHGSTSCFRCNGTGSYGSILGKGVKCSDCAGTGRKRCSSCNGTGQAGGSFGGSFGGGDPITRLLDNLVGGTINLVKQKQNKHKDAGFFLGQEMLQFQMEQEGREHMELEKEYMKAMIKQANQSSGNGAAGNTGNRSAKFCPKCGGGLNANSKFCSKCGSKIN